MELASELLDDLDPQNNTLIENENLEGSQPQPKKIVQDESQILLRTFTLLETILLRVNLPDPSGSICSLDTHIIPLGMSQENPQVRTYAVTCLGLFCLRKKEYAVRHMALLKKVAQADRPEPRKAALEVHLFYPH